MKNVEAGRNAMISQDHPARSLDRRTFLAAGVSMGLASPGLAIAGSETPENRRAHPRPDKLLAVLNYPCLLGPPSSWQAVEDGLFPISVERMVILRPTDCQSAIGFGEPADHQAPPRPDRKKRSERIAEVLATYYDLPDRKESWAALVALQDPLEPPVSCEGVFLSDMGQYGSSPLIHWWMFVSDESGRQRDEYQPHFTLVQASSGLDSREAGLAGLYLAHMTFRIHVSPRKWGRIASMSRLEATRFVNDQMVKALRGLPA
jgi:hypothetical protein